MGDDSLHLVIQWSNPKLTYCMVYHATALFLLAYYVTKTLVF